MVVIVAVEATNGIIEKEKENNRGSAFERLPWRENYKIQAR